MCKNVYKKRKVKAKETFCPWGISGKKPGKYWQCVHMFKCVLKSKNSVICVFKSKFVKDYPSRKKICVQI